MKPNVVDLDFGQELSLRKDTEKAVEDFNIVIRKNPKNAHAYFRRAFSLKSLKVSTFLIILKV